MPRTWLPCSFVIATALAACGPQAAAPAAPSPPKPIRYATKVVTIAPQEAVEILRGPFHVTSMNPGTELRLAVAKGTCDGATWFAYSGGGVAVGDGELLCAWSQSSAPIAHGFSGHD